jgi:hypothetical protein
MSQKSEVEDSLNSNTRLLTLELIPEPFDNILKTVIIRSKTVRNSTHEATLNYNSDIIVVDIREVSSETSDLRLYEYTRSTQEAQRVLPPLD